jgi:hypothetical protein
MFPSIKCQTSTSDDNQCVAPIDIWHLKSVYHSITEVAQEAIKPPQALNLREVQQTRQKCAPSIEANRQT